MSTGSVYKRKSDERWCACIRQDGKRRIAYARTEKEARRKLAALQKEFALSGALPSSGKKTLNDLLDLWLETAELRPQTRAGDGRVLDKYVRPALGKMRFSKLQPEHIQHLHNSLKESPGIATLVHQRLRRALQLAVLWGWVSSNPRERVVRPAYKAERKKLWTPEELATFLEVTREHWLGPLWVVAVTTGCGSLPRPSPAALLAEPAQEPAPTGG